MGNSGTFVEDPLVGTQTADAGRGADAYARARAAADGDPEQRGGTAGQQQELSHGGQRLWPQHNELLADGSWLAAEHAMTRLLRTARPGYSARPRIVYFTGTLEHSSNDNDEGGDVVQTDLARALDQTGG
jgi:hypothetical protein